MIGPPRLFRLLKLSALPLAASGCATMTGRTAGDERADAAVFGAPVAARPEAERGPRVRIWTTDEGSGLSRLRPVIRLEDDAYVIVVNVGLDGYANVLFPESPDDDGFMRGGRTYRLETFFPGFANHFHRTQYGRLYNATAAYDDIYDRYAGYVFVIASWRPMHFELTEAVGLWSDYRLAAHERRLEPYDVMHGYAARLVPGGRDYTARFARYAAFGDRFASGRSLSYCSLYGPMVGYLPWSLVHAGFGLIPTYGFGYVGGRQCGYGHGFALNTRPVVRRPTFTPPVRPPATGDSTDTRPPRRPATREDDDTERKSGRRPPRGQAEAGDETIVDVTRDRRATQRRAEGPRRAINRDRESERWTRAREAGAEYHDVGRRSNEGRAAADRDARGTSARDESSRPERSAGEPPRRSEPRSEPRTSEPRREAPPRYERPEARPEPRSEPRPQPPPRSEPASRPEPRGERPTKPADPT